MRIEFKRYTISREIMLARIAGIIAGIVVTGIIGFLVNKFWHP